jgi:hypothetical protein
MEESVNTLKFGARAKLIRIHAKINENLDDKTLLRAYREEIEALRNRLKELELKQQQQPAATVVPSVPLSSSSEKGPEKKEKPSSLPRINREREQEGQLDDNNSIEVNSSTDNIQETIHQIEDKILHSQSFFQGSGGSVGGGGGGGEEQQKMLQLIVAMEKLILKADNNNKSSSKSFRVKGGDVSRSMDITGGLQEGNGGTGKSFKKSSSFIAGGGGGAVVPVVRSQIPRRSSNNNNNMNNTISRSASNDKSMDNESVLKLSSADLDGLKVGSSLSQPTTPINEKNGLKSPNSSSFLKKKKENQKNFFFKPSTADPSHRDNDNDNGDEKETRPPISAESFENLLLETPAAEDEEKHQKKTKTIKGEEEKEEATDKLLKRNASIPFDDLQENFQKLGSNAERVLGHSVPRSGGKQLQQQRPEEDEQQETIEKQRSISPLTMCSSYQEKGFHSSAVHTSAEKPEYHPMEGIGGKEQTANFPHSPSHRMGIAANAGASRDHDHQQLLNTLSSMSAGGGGLLSLTPGSPLPMKNRIKRVKYAAEEGYMITTDTNPSYDTMDGSLQSNYHLLDREIEDDSVLLGVSKMLTLLKEHILRPKTIATATATATAVNENQNNINNNNNKTSR